MVLDGTINVAKKTQKPRADGLQVTHLMSTPTNCSCERTYIHTIDWPCSTLYIYTSKRKDNKAPTTTATRTLPVSLSRECPAARQPTHSLPARSKVSILPQTPRHAKLRYNRMRYNRIRRRGEAPSTNRPRAPISALVRRRPEMFLPGLLSESTPSKTIRSSFRRMD